MKRKFEIEFFDRVPIIKDGENVMIIDTGSPVTIHIADHLTFCETEYPCESNYMGLTVDQISKMFGKEVTTLLGMDILSNYEMLFDYRNGVVSFSTEKFDLDWDCLDLSDSMGLKILNFQVENRNANLFLDTGAKISYLHRTMTSGHINTGTLEDFNPMIGNFTTPCFEIETNLGENSFIVKYGNLPSLYEQALRLVRCDGVIGFDFFNSFKVLLDSQSNLIKFER